MKRLPRVQRRAWAYARKRMRQENADSYGFSEHDLQLVPGWLQQAWIAGHQAALRNRRSSLKLNQKVDHQ